MNVFVAFNFHLVSPPALFLDFQLVSQELCHPLLQAWKGVVSHHHHQACPKKAFPNEAFQMEVRGDPASTTGVYSLNIQLQGLHQYLMWQAMQPLHIKGRKYIRILEDATIIFIKKDPNNRFQPLILLSLFCLICRKYSTVQEVNFPSFD